MKEENKKLCNIITYYQYRNKMKQLCEEKMNLKENTLFQYNKKKTVKLIRALKPHKTENYLNKQSHSA